MSDQGQFQSYLEHCQQRVNNALDRCLPEEDPPEHNLAEAMRYSVIGGGKRIRPIMVYAAGATMGVEEDILDAPACAVEMIHAYSLIHDDLPAMDDDDLRRGKPTCHKAFDEATAILAGDALQALAYEILTDETCTTLPDSHRTRMLKLLTQASGAASLKNRRPDTRQHFTWRHVQPGYQRVRTQYAGPVFALHRTVFPDTG
jgi:farnesyl diphosphate synthase